MTPVDKANELPWIPVLACNFGGRTHLTEQEAESCGCKGRGAKARLIPLSEYGSKYGSKMLYWGVADRRELGEGFFSDLGALLNYCEQTEEEPPTLAWSCIPFKLWLDAGSIIDSGCEDQGMHDGAAHQFGSAAVEELQAFLNQWCEKHSPTSYVPNESLVVDLSAEVAAWKKEGER